MPERAASERLRALSVLVLVLVWISCGRNEHKSVPQPSQGVIAVGEGVQGAASPAEPKVKTTDARSSMSVYNLKAALIDQEGRTLGLDAFRGQPVIISMFYTSCATMCPLLINNLQRAERALPEDVRKATRVLLVSLDTARDTPERLKALAAERHIDTARWRLTGTSDASVRELAAVLNIRYRRMPGGEIAHSSVVTVLDRDGVPVLRVEDSMVDITALVHAINAIAVVEGKDHLSNSLKPDAR